MKRSGAITAVIVAVIVFAICCSSICAVLIAGYVIAQNNQLSGFGAFMQATEPTNTPVVVRPTAVMSPTEIAKSPGGSLGADPITPMDGQDGTLKTLQDSIVPVSDPYEIAARLEARTNVPRTLDAPIVALQPGAEDTFWAGNNNADEFFAVKATLRYITDHAYFWIEKDLPYRESELEALAETFENQIYPTNRAFFGSEWTPGVDGDPHIYILYARNLGEDVAGYFSSLDSINPLIQQYSNGHEFFMFNADNARLNVEYTYGVLAHEFQHMIHWYRDRNETSWLNEGFSDLAMFLNGYGIGYHDYVYADAPDIQLNDWPTDTSLTVPHYGASFLFLEYFLERFGETATQSLVANPDNGMDSIDRVLQELGATDPLTGEPFGADDLFADWVVTNYLNDANVSDGRYIYRDYPEAPKTSPTEIISTCKPESITRDVHQYGVDYIRIRCRGIQTLQFEGSTQVGVVPADPYSGSYAFWSNKGDESDMTLTQTFDFSGHSGPLTFSYWTWYDIEENYDYVYLEASTDGMNWELLISPSGTADDPVGSNYGWGYTGLSGGGPKWIKDEVDISRFAGKKVQLRFEYITDGAVNGEGFLLDDISIPETGYFSDFENDNGGWEAEGWVRIQNVLPQTFRLTLIKEGDMTTIENVRLTGDNTAAIVLDFDEIDDATLVISGTTRFTRQKAAYRIKFAP